MTQWPWVEVAVCGCPDRTTASPKQHTNQPKWLFILLTSCSVKRQTLLRSTVHGIKEFAPVDQVVIAAIKGKFVTCKIWNNDNV